MNLLKCCGLYALGMCLFLTVQSAIVSGSSLNLNHPTRVMLCILAILSIALGTIVWKPKRRLSAVVRFVLPALLIAAILLLGFRNNQTAALPLLPTP